MLQLLPMAASSLFALAVGFILARQQNSKITRYGIDAGLPFAHGVAYGHQVFLSGVTAQADGAPISERDSVEEQTRRVLAVIDKRLALAGTDKTKVLQAQVWLKDIQGGFAAMNSEWNKWVDAQAKPARATVEAQLAKPSMLVEIQVLAAL